MHQNRLLRLLGILAIACFMGASAVQAATLQIQFTGLNLFYEGDDSGGILCDATNCGGGAGDPADSDPLITAAFLLDGNLIGLLTTDIWADVTMDLENGLPDTGGTVGVLGGIFDLLTQNALPGWGLAVDIASGEVTYNGSDALLGSGTGTIFSVDLPFGPFGLNPGDPVTWSFSTQGQVSESEGFLRNATTAGTGQLTAPIPEPAAIALLGIALLGFGAMSRRRNADR